MMIVQMDKMSSPPSRELAKQLYEKNIELENKRRRSAQAKVPSDPNAWLQMRENYEAIILEDHTFSEQHNIEFALWQLHYRRIEEFRSHFNAALTSAGLTTSQGVKGPNRPDRITKIRLQFKTFLSEATGFYHDLIMKIRAKYGLPLGYFSEDSENQVVAEKDGKRSAEMKKGLVSCHRCLIYLGDLARYKGLYGEGDSKTRDYAAASSYYMQASYLWPSGGNPHHQLAILATYSGDELVAVYRYFRSLAVDAPFSTARDNLIVAFEKNRQSYSQLYGDVKSSASKESPVLKTAKGRGKAEAKLRFKDANTEPSLVGESAASIQETYKAFCVRFVRLNGILFTRTSLETFAEILSLVSTSLEDLLSSGPEEELNFGTDAVECGLTIVRLISILIFTVHNVNREADGQSYADIVQRKVLLQNSLTSVFELMGHILKRGVQLHDPSSSYLLPGIMVFLEWLACCPDVAEGSNVDGEQMTIRSTFWNHCISFLNKLLSNGLASIDDDDDACFFNMSRYDEGETENRPALWEDFELRGFVPLQPAHTILKFSRKHSFGADGKKEKHARVKRILAAGKALANVVRVDQKTLSFDLRVKKFVIGVEPQISDNFMLTSYPGSPKSVGRVPKVSMESMILTSEVMEPNAQPYIEVEEEDEVIVFKPTVTEKRSDVIDLKWAHSVGMDAGQNAVTSNSQFFGSPYSDSYSNIYQKTGTDASSHSYASSASVVNIEPQHMQPIQLHSTVLYRDQPTSLPSDLKDLSISESRPMMKPGLKEDSGISHIPSLLPPMQKSVKFNANDLSCVQEEALETVLPFNIGIASSGINSASLATNTSSPLPAVSKKSAVNRPVRHLGPPPGFSPFPPKVSVSIPVSGLTGENPLMDNYSWLDGYQLESSMKGPGLNQSASQLSHSRSEYIVQGNGSVGTINFPFPGKQAPAVQYPVEEQKGWHNHLTLERQNQRQDQLQHQNLMNGTQQFIPLPQQYQGQSIWADRYIV